MANPCLTNKFSRCFFGLALLSSLLVGCGFKLRHANTVNFPSTYQKIYLATTHPYSTFNKTLHQTLEQSGLQIVTQTKLADLILTVSHVDFSKYNMSILDNQHTENYRFIYQASIKLKAHQQRVVLPTETLRTMKITTIDSDDFANGNVLSKIKENLRDDLITKIINRLNAKEVINALNGKKQSHEMPTA